MGDSHKVSFSYCEENVLQTRSVEVARNETLLADRFDDGLVADFTDFAVKLKMLHCFVV